MKKFEAPEMTIVLFFDDVDTEGDDIIASDPNGTIGDEFEDP